jgi:lysine 2,3-aminomutase
MTRATTDVGQREVFSRVPGLRERLAGVADDRQGRAVLREMLVELEPEDPSVRFFCARRVLETITARWAEGLSGVRVTETLIGLARGKAGGVADGFLYELDGLLHALVEPAASEVRWGGDQAADFLTRYPAGTDRNVYRCRHKNRVRVLNHLGGSPSQWDDWIWQTRNTVRDRALLAELVGLSDAEKAALEAAGAAGVRWSVTPYYLSLFDEAADGLYDRALRNRVLPPATGLGGADEDGGATGAPLLVERLGPFSALVKPCLASPQYSCYEPPPAELDVTDSKLRSALEWFGDNPEVWEVVIGGGDVLCLTDSKVEGILAGLSRYKHIRRILIRSNFPVVMPQRFTTLLTKIISRYVKPAQLEVGLVTGFCHPYEVTPEAVTVVTRLRKAGVAVYNEAFYTPDNVRRFEFAALRRALKAAWIETSFSRLKTGAGGSGVPLARVLQEYHEEAALFPARESAQVPVVETAEGMSVPLWCDRTLVSIRPDDGRRIYLYRTGGGIVLDTDAPLAEFLEGMRMRGEDPADYAGLRGYV